MDILEQLYQGRALSVEQSQTFFEKVTTERMETRRGERPDCNCMLAL